MEWIPIVLGLLGVVKGFFWIKDRFFPKSELVISYETEAVATRFVELFAAHGVTRTQIPAFFDHGLSLANLKDDETLLPYLTETILNDACERFAVRREWLDGVDNQIYPLHDFYKYPENYQQFLDELETRTPLRQCHACAHTVEKSKAAKGDYDSVFIIAEPIGWAGNNEVFRFYICRNWMLRYWKSRGYFAACAAHSWKRGLTMTGTYNGFSRITDLNSGTVIPKEREVFGVQWHPEDLASSPEVYLAGWSKGTHDHAEAIAKWLELHEEGWMDFGRGYAEKMSAELRELNS